MGREKQLSLYSREQQGEHKEEEEVSEAFPVVTQCYYCCLALRAVGRSRLGLTNEGLDFLKDLGRLNPGL